jgi:7-carboxy-7-deazaguanine synthase
VNSSRKKISPDVIPVNETFFSIQGEGFYTGKAAYFIRFAGCDIGCKWCDTRDAWSVEHSSPMEIERIIQEATAGITDYVVITGGEPMYYNLSALTKKLRIKSKYVHIETSGAYPLRANFDWLSLSPKKIKLPLPEYYARANELKVIIEDMVDLEFALQQAERVMENCMLFVQPQWSKQNEVLPYLIEFIKENPKWRLSLQIHKFLGIK